MNVKRVFAICLYSAIGAAFLWLVYIRLQPMFLGGDDRFYLAKFDVRHVENAADAYMIRHRKWPSELKALTGPEPDGGPPLVKEERLIDGWSRPYQYDPKQLHPKTRIPKIWSDGPEPGRSKVIANWE